MHVYIKENSVIKIKLKFIEFLLDLNKYSCQYNHRPSQYRLSCLVCLDMFKINLKIVKLWFHQKYVFGSVS